MADATTSSTDADQVISVKVRDQSGDEMIFKVKKTTKMNKIFEAYAQKRGIEAAALRFLLDGEYVCLFN